jgi:hypothetical protein
MASWVSVVLYNTRRLHQLTYTKMIDHELDRKRNIKREQEWNKRNPKLSCPTSSLSLHSSTGSERVRTHRPNHLSHPDSSQSQSSVLSPNRQLHHHHSFLNTSRGQFTSWFGSSRASQNGKEESEEEEVVHERERNWNSPQPKWSQHASASRAQPRGSPSASSHFPRNSALCLHELLHTSLVHGLLYQHPVLVALQPVYNPHTKTFSPLFCK